MSSKLVPIAISSVLDVTGKERIHASPKSSAARPIFTIPVGIYLGINGQLDLRKSVDGGFTFTATPPTGVGTSSINSVCSAASRLYHGRTSTIAGDLQATADGAAFVPVTGLTGFSGLIQNVIKTPTEYQIYSTSSLHVSAEGYAFTPRDTGGLAVCRPVQFGSTILGIAASNGNTLMVSTDDGVNFASYTESIFRASTGIQSVVATLSGQWLAFGKSPSNALTVAVSPTGLEGSWVTITAPSVSSSVYCLLSAVSTTGRILMVLSNGVTYYTDVVGDTWIQGTSVVYSSPPSAFSIFNLPVNHLIYSASAEAFLIAAEQGSGINRVYRNIDGSASWELVFTAPSNRQVNGISEFP